VIRDPLIFFPNTFNPVLHAIAAGHVAVEISEALCRPAEFVSSPCNPTPRDAPINLPRDGGKSKFPRHEALFAKNGLMHRLLSAFSPGLPY
jgi:hypothetical protein